MRSWKEMQMFFKINPSWRIWFWKEIHLILKRNPPASFSVLTFSFPASCASLVSAICSAARWEIQMYSSRFSARPRCGCLQRSRSFLQKISNAAAAADGKKVLGKKIPLKSLLQNTFRISLVVRLRMKNPDCQQNVQNLKPTDKSQTRNSFPRWKPLCKNTQHTQHAL